MTRLAEKVALITGGGSWIGKEIATVFAREGAKLFIIGRDEKKLKETVKELRQLNATVDYCVADISQEQAVNRAILKILSLHGKIDILVQNAGIYPLSMIENMKLEDWKKVIDVNLTGSFIVIKAAYQALIKQGGGRVIFISSIAGEELGYPGLSHYSASKAGINGFMRTVALELAKYHITANSIEPGNIINAEALHVSETDIHAMLNRIPLKRVGLPLDVANLALFLASDESSFITGQNFIIDGGETISGRNISVDVVLGENKI